MQLISPIVATGTLLRGAWRKLTRCWEWTFRFTGECSNLSSSATDIFERKVSLLRNWTAFLFQFPQRCICRTNHKPIYYTSNSTTSSQPHAPAAHHLLGYEPLVDKATALQVHLLPFFMPVCAGHCRDSRYTQRTVQWLQSVDLKAAPSLDPRSN
jgi:hypothetical protein